MRSVGPNYKKTLALRVASLFFLLGTLAAPTFALTQIECIVDETKKTLHATDNSFHESQPVHQSVEQRFKAPAGILAIKGAQNYGCH
jgi:hypothetical protein